MEKYVVQIGAFLGCLDFFKGVFFPHQVCIYLIKNSQNCNIVKKIYITI